MILTQFAKHAEAIDHIRTALRTEPNHSGMHELLARNLEALKRDDDALAAYRQAVECDHRNYDAKKAWRAFLIRRGQVKEVMADWKKTLASDPPDHDACYGYAELCLYLGREDEYRTARSKLLARFANVTDPGVAERVSRTCLLRPAEGKTSSKR